MANDNAPFGFRPVRHLDGSPYNGAVNRYYLPTGETNNIFIGDVVISGGSADANGVPSIAIAAAGGNVRGVVVGFEPVNSESTLYRAASAERYALVADAPDLVFEVQEDSAGGNIAATSVGVNTDIVATAGNTAAARSNMTIDTTVTGTGAAQCRILGLSQRPGNIIGDYAVWDVIFNEHELKSTTGV